MLVKRPVEAKALQLLWLYGMKKKINPLGMPATKLRHELAHTGHKKSGALFFQLMDVLIEKKFVEAHKTHSPRRTYYKISPTGQERFREDYANEIAFLKSVTAGLPLKRQLIDASSAVYRKLQFFIEQSFA